MDTFACVDCRQLLPVTPGSTTGYGHDTDGHFVCFACCGARDETALRAGDFKGVVLYYNGKEVTNWPGTLRMPVLHVREGRHNMARVQRRIYFAGPNRRLAATLYGDNTQLLCRVSLS